MGHGIRAEAPVSGPLQGLDCRDGTRVQARLARARKEVVKLAQPETRITYASTADKRVSFGKGELSTENDVIEYAEALKQSWIKLVKSGKRIGLT